MSQITKNQIRNAILDLFEIEIPEAETSKAKEIRSRITEQKFDALNTACSALQDNCDIDFHEAVKKKEIAFASLHSDFENYFGYASKIEQIEKSINQLLDLVTNYCTQPPPESTPREEAQHTSLRKLTEIIYVANGQLEAESIRLFLNSFGIPARIDQESAGIVLGLTVGLLGEADVKVAPKDAEDSKRLLQAMKEGSFILPEEFEESNGDNDLSEIN